MVEQTFLHVSGILAFSFSHTLLFLAPQGPSQRKKISSLQVKMFYVAVASLNQAHVVQTFMKEIYGFKISHFNTGCEQLLEQNKKH